MGCSTGGILPLVLLTLNAIVPRRLRPHVANTGVVGAAPADSLTEEQLEQMLADRQLRREQSLLASSVTSTVCAGKGTVPAVGPVLSLEVTIEGLPVPEPWWTPVLSPPSSPERFSARLDVTSINTDAPCLPWRNALSGCMEGWSWGRTAAYHHGSSLPHLHCGW